MLKKVFYKSMTLITRLQDPYYHGAAAELGFYFIFSIVPVIALLTQILGYFGIYGAFSQILDAEFTSNTFIYSFLTSFERTLSGGTNLVFLIGALWAASKIEFSLIRISNYTYKLDGGNQITGYFKIRFRAVLTVGLLILLVLASLLVLVYGNSILALISSALDQFFGIEFHVEDIYMIMRWPVIFLIYFLFIAVNYSILPNKKVPLRRTLPGSLFASVGIIIASLAYQVYFSYFSNLNLIYGSLAAIIALLLWFYWLGYILLVGLILNAVWYEDSPEDNVRRLR